MKNLIEEQGRAFDERYFVLNSGQIIVRTDIKEGVIRPKDTMSDIKSFLTQSNRAVIERVVEMIDGKVFREKSPNELITDYLKRKNGYDTAIADLRAELMKEL